jgi:hypothetical protein
LWIFGIRSLSASSRWVLGRPNFLASMVPCTSLNARWLY